MESAQANLTQIESLLSDEGSKTAKLEKEFKLKKGTYDLLPNAEQNIASLQELRCESCFFGVDLCVCFFFLFF